MPRWNNVQRQHFDEHYTPEPMSGCWLWLRKVDRDGYGRIWTGSREIGAHKWSFIRTFGEIDPSLQVLHRCDTPSCVNPQHLFLGTISVNLQDASAKGRLAPFRRVPEQVKRQIADSSLARNATAKEFGVSPRTVQAIWKRVRGSKLARESTN
jgi:hypothetical protein